MIADQLRSAFPDHANRVGKILDEPNRFRCQDVTTSIVFVYATWSGYARQALSRCMQILNRLEVLSRLTIVNSDCVDYDEFEAVVGFLPQGYGELLWIVDGKVCHAMGDWRSTADETVERITRALGFVEGPIARIDVPQSG